MGFGRIFSRGGQKWWNLVLPLEIEKSTFFCWNFQNPGEGKAPPAPLPTPMDIRTTQNYVRNIIQQWNVLTCRWTHANGKEKTSYEQLELAMSIRKVGFCQKQTRLVEQVYRRVYG